MVDDDGPIVSVSGPFEPVYPTLRPGVRLIIRIEDNLVSLMFQFPEVECTVATQVLSGGWKQEDWISCGRQAVASQILHGIARLLVPAQNALNAVQDELNADIERMIGGEAIDLQPSDSLDHIHRVLTQLGIKNLRKRL